MSVGLPDDPPGDQSAQAGTNYGRRKRWLVGLLFLASAGLSIVGCFLGDDDSVLQTLLGLPILVLSIAWCFADARQRGHRIGRLMKLLLVLCLALAFPIYLFQTRGRRGAITLLQTLGVMTAVLLVSMATEWLTLRLGVWAGWWLPPV
jgi:hypothetical protein